MKLNHINLAVDDAAAASTFLETYFGMQPLGERDNMKVLRDDGHLVLTLMEHGRHRASYPKTFHVGFVQPTEDAVQEINDRLREGGYDVPPAGGARHTFYFDAPGGFKIEVLCLAGLVEAA